MKTRETIVVLLAVSLFAGCKQVEVQQHAEGGSLSMQVLTLPDSEAIPVNQMGLSKVGLEETGDPLLFEPVQSDPGDGPLPERSWEGYPPVIPHSLDGLLPITMKDNQCIDCHGIAEQEAGEPTPVPPSHYEDLRNAPGSQGDEVDGARFNCLLCHSPRTDANPLVLNDFER